MAQRRQQLQTLLETLLGSENVYFQPPSNVEMKYPCIVYKRSTAKTTFADNNPYSNRKRYTVTVIDRNPDSVIPDKIAEIQSSFFDRYYTVDGLHHDVYALYY